MITLKISTTTCLMYLHIFTRNAHFLLFFYWIMTCQFHTDVITLSFKYVLCTYSGQQTENVCRKKLLRFNKENIKNTSFPEQSESFYDINKQFYYSVTIFRLHCILFRIISKFGYTSVYKCHTLKGHVFSKFIPTNITSPPSLPLNHKNQIIKSVHSIAHETFEDKQEIHSQYQITKYRWTYTTK